LISNLPERNAPSQDEIAFSDGYARAVELLKRCSTPDGFLAFCTDKANYRRIWGRDRIVIGLGALLTADQELIDVLKGTLKTLARYQGPHGEIPSNVDTTTERVSYGGTTGCVDADLWFVISCAEYWRATGDDGFLAEMLPTLEKVRFLLGEWEFDNHGLLYVPQTGDWADEYVHNAYVLYDQLLYLQAQRSLRELRVRHHGCSDHCLDERITRLKHLVQDNYWFQDDQRVPDDVYHEVLYRQGRIVARRGIGTFWMPFFAPHGYGYRFDALANVLASLLNVANDEQRERVDRFIQQTAVPKDFMLLPAFCPVIKLTDKDWEELHITFFYTFKNQPYEYQTGGLWPMITGFYVADLAMRGRTDRAREFLAGIHRANALEMNGAAWSFPEFVHGQAFTAGGTRWQGCSAAAAIIGHHALQGTPVFRIGTP
jgi:hypothetical protein